MKVRSFDTGYFPATNGMTSSAMKERNLPAPPCPFCPSELAGEYSTATDAPGV